MNFELKIIKFFPSFRQPLKLNWFMLDSQSMCEITILVIIDRFGDRISSVNSQDFSNIGRRDATEVLRSCDQLTITMEIGRITSHVKPLPQVG